MPNSQILLADAGSARQRTWLLYCRNHVYEFLQKLNAERGWNLIGGNQEFGIPSGLTAAGRYRFDGCDRQRLIFFEYNEKPHRFPDRKECDEIKKARLKEWLKERGLEGKGTYIVYDQVTNTLTEDTI